tara:strand:+ start:83 stop:679 length:597 start_codon:yes stop_codon:yes gene_type:complete
MKKISSLGQLILASESPRRKEILNNIGLNFKVYSSKIDETEFKKYSPRISATLCAEKKAKAASQVFDNNFIIAADTIVSIKGAILGKPKSEAESYEMLKMLSGKSHKVLTGVSVCKKNENLKKSFCSTTEVKIKPLSDDVIKFYIENFNPFDKAGSYGIQDWFSCQVESIKGCYFNVMGLPLSKLYELLLNLSHKQIN